MLRLSDSENVMTGFVFKPMFVEPSAGVTDTTVGGVVSDVAAVVNELTKLLHIFPDRSVGDGEELFTRTVIVVLPGRGVEGVNVSTVPALFKE